MVAAGRRESRRGSTCPPDVFPEEWDLDGLVIALGEVYPTTIDQGRARGR